MLLDFLMCGAEIETTELETIIDILRVVGRIKLLVTK